jgi:hypothetical protein
MQIREILRKRNVGPNVPHAPAEFGGRISAVAEKNGGLEIFIPPQIGPPSGRSHQIHIFQIWSPRRIIVPKRIREFARQLRQISTRKSAPAPTKVKINVNINVNQSKCNVNSSRLKSSLKESKNSSTLGVFGVETVRPVASIERIACAWWCGKVRR